MNFDYYRIFYYAAKYKNFTQAAAVLLSSQPNVTRVINALEHELDCRLFVRSNRGISLTPEGERLYRHVSVAFEELQAGEAELTRSLSLQSGTIYIGASETALHGLLLEVLQIFHREYPGVHLKISNHSTTQALDALKSGQIDFAMVTAPTNISKPMKSVRLKPYHDILVGGPQFAFLCGEPHHLKDLSHYPLISMAQNTSTYALYNQLYLEQGLMFQPDIEVATTDLVLPMVKNDLGLGFIPRSFANQALQDGDAVEIPLIEELPTRYICLIYDSGRGLSIAARTLQQMIYRHAEEK